MFCDRLRELRRKNGCTQSDLATSLGVSQSTVGNWEAGIRQPNFSTLKRLAKIFNVSVDYLLGRDDEKDTGKSNPKKISYSAEFPELETLYELTKTLPKENVKTIIKLLESLLEAVERREDHADHNETDK